MGARTRRAMGVNVPNLNILAATQKRRGSLVRHAIGSAKGAKAHKLARLDAAASLANLMGQLGGGGAIVADPTGAFDRAFRLVKAAREARWTHRKMLKGLYIGRNGRVLYARVKKLQDAPEMAAKLGDALARALIGTGVEIAVVVRASAPPKGALRVEDVKIPAKVIAAHARATTAAVAVGGFAAGAAMAQPAPAYSPNLALHATLQTSTACGTETPRATRDVRLVYTATGGLRVTANDDGMTDADGAAALAFARSIDEETLRGDPLDRTGPNGERIISITRLVDERRREDHFVLKIALCAPMAPMAAEAPAEPAAPPPPPPAPVESPNAYREVGADYIDRTEQDGLIASGTSQWQIAPNWDANAQVAIGQIDGDLAVGGQIAAQRFMQVGRNAEAAIGGFVSAINSKAPDNDDFSIYRAGAGVSWTGQEVQIIVRGGYAASAGYLDDDGGFLRAEAAWFPIERASISAFVEGDPITGTGGGVGVTVRPFSDVLANLMIDADAAWHEDGEDSFRLGFRWLIGDGAAQASERERHRRIGMVPYLPQEFERLPEGKTKKQSYGGSAGTTPPTTPSAPA